VHLGAGLVHRRHSQSKHELILEGSEAVVHLDIDPVGCLIAGVQVEEPEGRQLDSVDAELNVDRPVGEVEVGDGFEDLLAFIVPNSIEIVVFYCLDDVGEFPGCRMDLELLNAADVE
jgi:hypothetical protein